MLESGRISLCLEHGYKNKSLFIFISRSFLVYPYYPTFAVLSFRLQESSVFQSNIIELPQLRVDIQPGISPVRVYEVITF